MIATAKVVCFIFCFGSTGGGDVAADTFCAVARQALRDGLKFSRAEAEALSDRNRRDLAALKREVRKCPPVPSR